MCEERKQTNASKGAEGDTGECNEKGKEGRKGMDGEMPLFRSSIGKTKNGRWRICRFTKNVHVCFPVFMGVLPQCLRFLFFLLFPLGLTVSFFFALVLGCVVFSLFYYYFLRFLDLPGRKQEKNTKC
mmetsp:Transcript_8671/g.23337  ORF Transcript_8671/g.23337 Transcript_8671/m.23337 type:complete len:127 (-) Transcript_8671:276-656(-)